jgi:hypothetical protein
LESAQNAAKASSEECRKSQAFGKGAAEDLKPSYAKASAWPAIGWVLLGRAPPAIVWGRRIFIYIYYNMGGFANYLLTCLENLLSKRQPYSESMKEFKALSCPQKMCLMSTKMIDA